MNADDPSPLTPDHGDLEKAREAEIRPLEAPRFRGNGRRWLAVAVLTAIGLATFAAAWYLSGEVPADGVATAEARVTALVTLGATTVAAAVSLAAVVLTLGIQREQERQRRWADFQVEMLGDAFDWIDGIYSRFGRVIGAMQEWGHALDEDQEQKRTHAAMVLQDFYDHGQHLGEVERLERLIADRQVRAALRKADGALREFNEMAAGDHTTRAVRVEDIAGDQWLLFGELGDARDQIRDAYADAVRSALHGA